LAKERIVILPSAWPWVQGKVPNISCRCMPSSLTPLSVLLLLVLSLSSASLANSQPWFCFPSSLRHAFRS